MVYLRGRKDWNTAESWSVGYAALVLGVSAPTVCSFLNRGLLNGTVTDPAPGRKNRKWSISAQSVRKLAAELNREAAAAANPGAASSGGGIDWGTVAKTAAMLLL